MNILETKDLSHHWGGGRNVLSKVNLKIKAGERHGIIGPNGAGKTTLFNMLSGEYVPASGAILFKETDITGMPPHKINRMGMGRAFQITSIFPKLTVFQNVRAAVLSKNGIRYNFFRNVNKMVKITEETDEILKKFDLDVERDQLANTISYGRGRALELIMSMATNPDLVLLDEPTAGISKDQTQQAIALIKKATEGKTSILIEHDMDVVYSLADRVTVLHHGEILATGTPEEISNNQEVKDAYLGIAEF